MRKGKKLYAVIAVAICGVLAAGGAGWHLLTASAKETAASYQEVTLQHGDLELTFTGEGTTAEGSTEQTIKFDASAVDFTVAECYISSGDEVKAGDALYQLSEESINEAAAYYEEAIADASKEADTAKSAYEAGKAKAEYTRTETKTTADSAKEVYNAANSSLDQKAAEAEAVLNETKTQISVYQTNLDQNKYYTDAGVEEKQKNCKAAEKTSKQAKTAYEEAQKAYTEASDAVTNKITELQQNISASADTSADMAAVTEWVAELSAANQTLAEKKAAFAEAEAAYQSALQAAEKAKEEYNTANTSYEKAVSDATARKESLENSLSSLELSYTNALNAAATGKVDNQNTYDTAVLEGQYAEVTYEDTVSDLKSAYDEAEENLAELKEEQSALLSLVDGMITAESDGTLSAVYYEAGDVLNSNIALVGYSDTNKLTVAVEVAQENIAKVSVGDTVSVSIMGRPGGNDIEGTVSSIAAEATSGRSMSNVTYTVEVTIDNTEGQISANASAYVTFSYGKLSDVDYILTEALDHIDGTAATVKTYNADGEVEEMHVTIGESADRHTVITGGITEDTICLIEAGGKDDEQTAQ